MTSALALADRVGKISDVLIHHRIYTDQARAKMFRKHYSQVLFVYLEIKEFLRQNGMYAPLSTAFLNMTASRCYRIYNILCSDSKEHFWNMLNDKYAEDLGWNDRETEDFEEKEVCEFVANVILYTHKQYKKRVEKGHHLNLDKLTAVFKNNSSKKKFRSFFSCFAFRRKKNAE